MSQERFTKAPNYQSTPQDALRVGVLKEIEKRKEELEQKRKWDKYYDNLLA